jgi:hypothetical protein
MLPRTNARNAPGQILRSGNTAAGWANVNGTGGDSGDLGSKKNDALNPRRVDSESGSLAFMAAVALHCRFNHLLVQPMSATLMITAALPVVFVCMFRYSEPSLRDWMETGLDSKLQLLNGLAR